MGRRDKDDQVPYIEHGKGAGSTWTITGTISRDDIPAVVNGQDVRINDSETILR